MPKVNPTPNPMPVLKSSGCAALAGGSMMRAMTTQDEVNVAAAGLAYELSMLLDGLDLEEHKRRNAHKYVPPGFKRCSTCQWIKPAEDFYRYHRSKDGRLGRCKACFLKARNRRMR